MVVEVEDHAGRKTRHGEASPSSRSGGEVGHARAGRCAPRRVAADDVREDPRALLELHVGEHVGQALAEAAAPWFWCVTVKVWTVPRPLATKCSIVSVEARHAERARAVLHRAAGAAALEHELAASRRLPTSRASPSRRSGPGGGSSSPHHALPRISVAPLWATPSVPPVPWTSARRASSTWRSPQARRAAAGSPRSTRKMPRMPGWFDERPPPSGFTGSAPPSAMRPPVDERAALARRAEAEVLERREHRDRERVVDGAEVEVAGRTPAMPRASRARLVRGDRQEVGRAELLVGDRLAAAEHEHGRLGAGRGRARRSSRRGRRRRR